MDKNCNISTVKPVYNDHSRETKTWSLITGSRYSQVNYILRMSNLNGFKWSLKTGDLSSQVVANTGLTVCTYALGYVKTTIKLAYNEHQGQEEFVHHIRCSL